MIGLEHVYSNHHKNRGDGFVILPTERGHFLRKHIGNGKKILDLGCRDGSLTATYAAHNEVTGADIDQHALELAENKLGIKTVHADLNAPWPFSQETYDVVVACEFLEHVYFPEVVFAKIKHVLKRDGLFVGTIPHAYSFPSRIKFLLGIKRGTALDDPTHINHFAYADFKKSIGNHFEIVEIIGYVPPRYHFLSKLFPFAFAYDLFFCVKKNNNHA